MNINKKNAEKVHQRLRQRIIDVFGTTDISSSLACFPEDGDTPEKLLHKLLSLDHSI
jgi:hypothetical protein